MPIFEITGSFVAHDVRYADTVSMKLAHAHSLTRAMAEALLWPLATHAVRAYSGDDYPFTFTSVYVIEHAKSEDASTVLS